MSHEFDDVLYDVSPKGVARLTINREHAYNAYTTHTLQEIREALRLAAFDHGVYMLVLTGSGKKAFCTGGDVKEYADHYVQHPNDFWQYMVYFQDCLDAVRHLGKPTIARLNGMTVGGGNEFNMACDLAVMADHAVIRQVGTRVGSVAAGGGTQWLPIIVGDRRARELLYFSEPISPATALDWGLVNRVAPYEELDTVIDEWTEKLTDKFGECLRYTQEATNYWKDSSWYGTIGHAREWLALHFAHPEPQEGMQAFVEKRAPDYRAIRERQKEGRGDFWYGAPVRVCPSCGAHAIPVEFKFCGVCGEAMSKEGQE